MLSFLQLHLNVIFVFIGLIVYIKRTKKSLIVPWSGLTKLKSLIVSWSGLTKLKKLFLRNFHILVSFTFKRNRLELNIFIVIKQVGPIYWEKFVVKKRSFSKKTIVFVKILWKIRSNNLYRSFFCSFLLNDSFFSAERHHR